MVRIVTHRHHPRRKPDVAAEFEPQPRISHAPWAGYDRHDHRRTRPLAVCPAKKCQRARACLSPHLNVYCRRTHFSRAEFIARETAAGRYSPHVPQPPPQSPLEWEFRLNDLEQAAERKRRARKAMVERWKAGEFDQLYGKYTSRGVILMPPRCVYVDER